MKDKWFSIFMMVLVLTIGSCSVHNYHESIQYKIAKLECQQNEAGE